MDREAVDNGKVIEVLLLLPDGLAAGRVNERKPCLSLGKALQYLIYGPYQPIIDFQARSINDNVRTIDQHSNSVMNGSIKFSFLEYRVALD